MSTRKISHKARAAGPLRAALESGRIIPDDAVPIPEYRNPVSVRFDLLDPVFVEGMAQIMGVGAQKWGADNWKSGLTGANSGLNHALKHISEFQRGVENEYGDRARHLEQAAVNLMFEAFHWRRIAAERERFLEAELAERARNGGNK